MNKSSKRIRIADRKKAFFSILLVSLALCLLCFGSVYSKQLEQFERNEPEYVTHTVARGETLWGIAERCSSDKDIREIIYEIRQANNLDECNIYPGDVLQIPTFK